MPFHNAAPEGFQPPEPKRRLAATVWTAVLRNRLVRALVPWLVLVLLAYVVGTLVVGPMIVAAAGIRRPPIAPTPAAVEGREPPAKAAKATSIDDAKTTYAARSGQPDEPDVQIEQVSSSERHRRRRRHHRSRNETYTSRRRASDDGAGSSSDSSPDVSSDSAADSAADMPAPTRRRHRRHHRSSGDSGDAATGDRGQAVDRSDSGAPRDTGNSGDMGADRGGRID